MRMLRLLKESGDKVAFFPDGSIAVEESMHQGEKKTVSLLIQGHNINIRPEGGFETFCDNLDAERESWTGNR